MRRSSLITTALLLWPALSATALIPSADGVLASAARRREGLGIRSLVVEGVLRRPGQEDVRVREILLAGTGRRTELGEGEDKTVILTLGQRQWTTQGKGRPVATTTRPDLILYFLGDSAPHAATGREFLSAYEIDDDVVSLARLDRQIAFSIGAHPWESDKPQLWVDKSFRTPTRLVEQVGTDRHETRLLGWGSAQTGEWWPQRVEHWVNGQRVDTTIYGELRVNEPVDAALFRPPPG